MNQIDNNLLVGLEGAVATIIASTVAFVLSNKYYKHTKSIEHDRMMKDLFKEFNERFDKINNQILVITKMTEADILELEPEKQLAFEGVIMDFFNICSEEYFWNKKGRFDSEIWDSWFIGMNDIYDKSSYIQQLWEGECKNEGYKSYYLTAKNDLFLRA